MKGQTYQGGGGVINFHAFQNANYKIVITFLFAAVTAVIATYFVSGISDLAIVVGMVAVAALMIATFCNINIGLVAILLSMLLSPELELGSTPGRAVVVRAEDLLLFIVSLAWLARMAIKKQPVLRRSPLNVPIGLFVAILCFSTIRGMITGTVTPLKGFFYVLKMVEYFVLYFMVLNHTTSARQVKLFLGVLLFTSIVVGIYGNTHLGEAGRLSAPFEGKGEPNTLGGYLLFILSIVGGLIFYYRKRRRILVLIFLFLVPTFVFTVSRSSYLGMFPALAVFAALSKNKNVIKYAAALVLAFILAVAFGPPVLKNRVLGAFEPETQQELKRVGMISLGPSPAARLVSWKDIMTKKFARRPLLGSGVTGLAFLDSQYVLTIGETGIIGLSLFLWLMWRAWRAAGISYGTVETPLFKGLVLGYMAGLAGLMFHAIGSNTFIIIRIAEPFWFFTAIVVKLRDIETGKAAMSERISR